MEQVANRVAFCVFRWCYSRFRTNVQIYIFYNCLLHYYNYDDYLVPQFCANVIEIFLTEVNFRNMQIFWIKSGFQGVYYTMTMIFRLV